MQRPSYKVFAYTLAAGQQVPIHHRANSLNCLAATARFQIGFDDAPLTTFEKGLGYQAEEEFSKVRLLNDSDAEITVELGFASGGVTDSRLNIPGAIETSVTGGQIDATINGAVDANITNAVDANITNAVLVAVPSRILEKKVTAQPNATKILTAKSSTRREILITNLGAETVYLGGGNVRNGEGLPIGSGKTATLQSTGAFYVFNPSATAQNIAVLELLG